MKDEYLNVISITFEIKMIATRTTLQNLIGMIKFQEQEFFTALS
jgi:hypothetical protein